MIKELIVVEGKNDAQAVRRALGPVDVMWTEGYGLTKDKLDYIAAMAQRQGVIVLTDPDTVGEQIRERICRRAPEAKHVYLTQAVARLNGDIGVENALPEEIRKAFAQVRQAGPGNEMVSGALFSMLDLLASGLAGKPDAAASRARVGRSLGIGEANAKQFLHRLNRFGVARAEFWRAVREEANEHHV